MAGWLRGFGVVMIAVGLFGALSLYVMAGDDDLVRAVSLALGVGFSVIATGVLFLGVAELLERVTAIGAAVAGAPPEPLPNIRKLTDL